MPFDNNTHLIFEKYRIIKENVENKLPFLVKSVPDNISGIFSTKEKDEKRELQEKEVFVKKVAQEYDPSNEKIYTGWILKMMLNGSIRGEEDMQKTKETLLKTNCRFWSKVFPTT